MRKEFNAASGVEQYNTNQLNMIVGGEPAAVEKGAKMLHQSSVILDARDSQCMSQVSKNGDLLKIQDLRQGLIRHVNIRDHRRQVGLPVHIPSVYFEKLFG